jgi:hypothetical protein
MIPLRWISLGLVASLWLATPVRAGTFVQPFTSSGICGDFDVAASLSDPNTFASSPHCTPLCRMTVSDCKKLARKIASCYSSYFSTTGDFEKRNCAEQQPASAARDCKAAVSAATKVIEKKVDATRASNFTSCETWGTNCQATCAH